MFFFCCMYRVTAASPLNFWLHPGNLLCPSHQCVLYPILGHWLVQGLGKCAGLTLPSGAKTRAEVERGHQPRVSSQLVLLTKLFIN